MFMTDADVDAILRQLGATAAPTTRAGARTSLEFFRLYMPEMALPKQLSYMKAMDLSKKVEKVDLMRGEKVIAFRHHTADFGEFHSRVGNDPTRMGIQLAGRQFREFEVVQRVAALSSYASAFKNMALGSGGALQLVIPRASMVLRVTQRGIGIR